MIDRSGAQSCGRYGSLPLAMRTRVGTAAPVAEWEHRHESTFIRMTRRGRLTCSGVTAARRERGVARRYRWIAARNHHSAKKVCGEARGNTAA